MFSASNMFEVGKAEKSETIKEETSLRGTLVES